MHIPARLLTALCGIALCAPAGAAEIAMGGSRRIAFNEEWRFAKGDPAGAEQPGFRDAGWRELELPHDWAIEGPFDPKYDARCGIAWRWQAVDGAMTKAPLGGGKNRQKPYRSR